MSDVGEGVTTTRVDDGVREFVRALCRVDTVLLDLRVIVRSN